jgi:acyl-[acyl carrier protein]--UDP-N-acetylglucosamine O-acyltransferase
MGRNRFIGYSVIASAVRADCSVDGRFMMGTSASVNGRLMMRARVSMGAHFGMRTHVSVGARCMVLALVSIGGSAYPASVSSALMPAARFALTTFLTMIRLVG